jgi:hypothetical protein
MSSTEQGRVPPQPGTCTASQHCLPPGMDGLEDQGAVGPASTDVGTQLAGQLGVETLYEARPQ